MRANCDRCGEEIINEREVVAGGQTLCRGCAGPGHYHPLAESHTLFFTPSGAGEVVFG